MKRTTICFCTRHASLAALLVAAVVTTAQAEVFDGGGASTDFNTAANWENDTIPGTAGGEFAIIGQAGMSSGGVPS